MKKKLWRYLWKNDVRKVNAADNETVGAYFSKQENAKELKKVQMFKAEAVILLNRGIIEFVF